MISMRKLIGKGFDSAWYSSIAGPCRYRVFVGAKNAKKSVDIAGFEPIDKVLSNPVRNILFVRMNDSDNASSTYNNAVWCLSSMGLGDVSRWFWVRTQPNLIEYRPTGQVMMFRGLSDPLALAGIKTKVGVLTDVYVEEASQIADEADFQKLDLSIRGALPDGVQLQITFLLNPWDIDSWIYKRFCRGRLEENADYLESHDTQEAYYPGFMWGGKGLYIHRSTFRVNEFRTPQYDEVAESVRERSPLIYRTEFLGMWGNTVGQTYPEWSDRLIITDAQARSGERFCAYSIGIDTGLSNGEGTVRKDGRVESATVAELIGITDGYGKIISLGEYFWTNEGKAGEGIRNEARIISDILSKIAEWKSEFSGDPVVMKGQIPVLVDSADNGFRDNLQMMAGQRGLWNLRIMPSTKMKIIDRVRFIRLLMAYGEFEVSQSCPNLAREIKNAKKGPKGEIRWNMDDHATNACEYAWAPFYRSMIRYGQFKET